MDREAWHAEIHGIAKSRTRLSDWTELNWRALRKENTCDLKAIRLVATTYSEPWGTEMHMIAGPIAEMPMKLMISVSPDSYISPCIKKALNSLTWDICFCLINNNLLMFRPPALCCKTSYTTWLLLSPAWSSFRRVTWDAVSHQIKHISQLLGCDDFLSQWYLALLRHYYSNCSVNITPCYLCHNLVSWFFCYPLLQVRKLRHR